jgi:GT2 family glycosyltransferase
VLDDYEGQTAPPGAFEVLVVVDTADPNPAAAEQAIGARPYPLRRLTGSIPGLAANRNAGWQAAEAPIVLFTDNDTLPSPQLVAEHLAWHRRNPGEEIGVLGHVQWAREVRVTPFMRWLDHGMQFDYPNIKGTEAGWGRFYGANVSVKKGLVERVGGFDAERLPYLYEDLDFGYRASKLGFRLLYNRRAVIEHLREVDIEYWRKRMRRAAGVERRFVEKHPEIPPWFKRKFTAALESRPASGRGVRLIRWVPSWLPWLGPRVWASADLYYRQLLAPDFLAAWDEREPDEPGAGPVAPYLLEGEAVNSRDS